MVHISLGRPSRAARRATALVFFSNGMGCGLWAAYIPSVQAHLGIGPATLGLSLLSLAAGAVLALPVAGPVIGKVGSRAAVIATGLAYGVALGLPLAVPTLGGFLGAGLLLGATSAVLDLAMNTQGARVEQVYHRPLLSGFHACFSLGGMAGAVLAGAMLRLHTAQSVNLLGAGLLLGVLIAGAGAWFLPDRVTSPRRGFVLPNRAALGLGVLALCAFMAEGAITDWSAIHLRTVAQASPAVAPLGFAAFSIAMTIGRLTGDAVVQRVGRDVVLGASGLLAAGGILVTATGWLGLALVGFGLAGLGLANVVPLLCSAGAMLPGLPASLGVAMVVTLGYAGFLVGPPLIGWIAGTYGIRVGLLLIIPGLLLLTRVGFRR